ncbi:hypothetical protein RQP46_000857 [Phenoliferia psychrophenolica]
MKLNELPSRVLERIVHFALLQDRALRSVLLRVDQQIASATFRTLVHSVNLEDDDCVLVQAEDATGPAATPLAAIWRRAGLADAVRSLNIHQATTVALGAHAKPWEDSPSRDSTPAHGASTLDELDDAAPPLEETSFLLLLSKLPSLTSFTWASTRTPPDTLCAALGTSAKNLTTFVLNLARETDPSTQLPISLEGVRSLATCALTLPALEHLRLSRTLFVDDSLLETLSEEGRLKTLAIEDMHGTKLTDKGLVALFEGCAALEELELTCVEGRLSKGCWTSVAPNATALQRVRIAFSESGPHKTWTTDHLVSLHALIASPALHSLAVARIPPPGALAPGRHRTSLFPMSEVVVPKAMSDKMLDAIVDKGPQWKKLDLSLWSMDSETTLKRILDKTTALVDLTVYLDSPFKSLLLLTTSFAISHELRQLTVSIDPRHTPELLTPIYGYPLTPASSPQSRNPSLPSSADAGSPFQPFPPSSPPISLRSLPTASPQSTNSSPSSNLAVLPDSPSVPATKEWRRFLKKATHKLARIDWTGRGGLGSWKFDRTQSVVKVDFVPLSLSSTASSGVDEKETGSPLSWSPLAPRSRRMSSASLSGTCFESINLYPATSPVVGLGLNLPLGAPPFPISPSPHAPTASRPGPVKHHPATQKSHSQSQSQSQAQNQHPKQQLRKSSSPSRVPNAPDKFPPLAPRPRAASASAGASGTSHPSPASTTLTANPAGPPKPKQWSTIASLPPKLPPAVAPKPLPPKPAFLPAKPAFLPPKAELATHQKATASGGTRPGRSASNAKGPPDGEGGDRTTTTSASSSSSRRRSVPVTGAASANEAVGGTGGSSRGARRKSVNAASGGAGAGGASAAAGPGPRGGRK